ncbi:MAG: nitroreductase family protein [Chloroflexota bacterium]|nr:nitroreductase family protein [Chloroflexota bacterium]
MDISEVMRTAFAAREFTNDEISDETIYRILEHARFAPSGGNRQGCHVIVIREKSTKNALAKLAKTGMRKYVAQVKNGENPWNSVIPTAVSEQEIAATEISPDRLAPLTECPVLVAVIVDLGVVASMDKDLERVGVISGASIYPLAWNIILMARNEGYGGAITTFIAPEEDKARKILNVPDNYAICALIPIGKPVKQLTKLSRKPVEEITSRETFTGDRFHL